MKRIIATFALIAIVFLTACVKYTSEYRTVTVTVSEAYYYPQTTRAVYKEGKFDHMDIDPPIYRTVVEFEGRKYYFNNPEYYFDLYNKIGEQTDAKLEERHYENGKTRYNIVALKTEESHEN